MADIFEIDCSALECDGVYAAATAQDPNCPNDVYRSEVNSIILIHPVLGTPIANWGASMTALDFDIDNADATSVKQKQFFGVGNVAEPEEVTTTLNDFSEVVLARKNTLSFEIYDVSQETRDFFRQLQCGKLPRPKLYYTTVADKIYGAEMAIPLISFKATELSEQGEDAITKWQITAIWDSKVAPDRYDYPL